MDILGASQCFSHLTYLLSYAQSVILLAVRSYHISMFVFQHTKEYLRIVDGNSSLFLPHTLQRSFRIMVELCDMCLLGTKRAFVRWNLSSTGPRHIFSCCILSCQSLSWEHARCCTYTRIYIISFDKFPLPRIPCLAGIDKKHVPQHSPNVFITRAHKRLQK